MRPDVAAGLGLIGVGALLPAGFLLEAATRPGGTDGDNPAESLVYLQEHGTAYALSGVCLIVAALSLLGAGTSVRWRTPFLTALAGVAAGLLVFAGALRVSSPGPIDHIAGYDEDWGEAAYLVVQMGGTQGGLLGGLVVFQVWIIASCLAAWRSRVLPRTLCILGLVALVYLLGTGVSLVLEVPDVTWALGVAALVLGLPGWCLATGVWSLARRDETVLTTQ